MADEPDQTAEDTEPVAAAAVDEESEPEPLPTHKPDLVALAIDRGVPSYEAWAMTVPDLTAKLKES